MKLREGNGGRSRRASKLFEVTGQPDETDQAAYYFRLS